MSIDLWIVPSAWRTAVIIHKCAHINGPGDLRFISVTLLSRMVEHLVVRGHMYPEIHPAELYDKYGFKLTGNTTSALSDITNNVTITLEDSNVRFLLIVFLKPSTSSATLYSLATLKSIIFC